MAMFRDPFGTFLQFQQALDALRASSWLESSTSGGGPFRRSMFFARAMTSSSLPSCPASERPTCKSTLRAERSALPAPNQSSTARRQASIVASGWPGVSIAR